jgi:hypothetical protein
MFVAVSLYFPPDFNTISAVSTVYGFVELNYLAFSIMVTMRHLFVFERGLVSMISTLSPIPHSFFSSCA